MRHMPNMEPSTSLLHVTALRLVLIQRNIFVIAWSSIVTACEDPSSGSITPVLSVYTSLFKLLKLDSAQKGEQGCSEGNKSRPPQIHVQQTLDAISMFVCVTRDVWAGKRVPPPYRPSFVAGLARDSSMLFQAWLQAQLILFRSWKLVWTQLRNMVSSKDASFFDVTLTGMLSGFKQRCSIGDNDSFMEDVMDACGLSDDVEHRFHGDVPEGHVRLERFAIQHLDVKVLPGCGFWGCLNMTGISEAAIPTQLCSGCRRARYCSVKCQRAAWVTEGHRDVCKGL